MCSLGVAPGVGDGVGGADVCLLGGLVSASQQQDQTVAFVQEVHPVSRAIVDTQLGDTPSDRLNVSGIADCQPVDSDEYARCCASILELA